MRSLTQMSLLALLLTGASFAQQEINPDRFEGEAAKQPVKVKQVAKAHAVQAKRHAGNKSASTAVLSARVVAGN